MIYAGVYAYWGYLSFHFIWGLWNWHFFKKVFLYLIICNSHRLFLTQSQTISSNVTSYLQSPLPSILLFTKLSIGISIDSFCCSSKLIFSVTEHSSPLTEVITWQINARQTDILNSRWNSVQPQFTDKSIALKSHNLNSLWIYPRKKKKSSFKFMTLLQDLPAKERMDSCFFTVICCISILRSFPQTAVKILHLSTEKFLVSPPEKLVLCKWQDTG